MLVHIYNWKIKPFKNNKTRIIRQMARETVKRCTKSFYRFSLVVSDPSARLPNIS